MSNIVFAVKGFEHDYTFDYDPLNKDYEFLE